MHLAASIFKIYTYPVEISRPQTFNTPRGKEGLGTRLNAQVQYHINRNYFGDITPLRLVRIQGGLTDC